MITSDATLRDLPASRTISVEPMEPGQIQPASIDLRLGRHFLKVDQNGTGTLGLDSGRRICQIVFAFMDKAAARPYSGKYQGQSKTVGSRAFQNAKNRRKE
jgi:deoxycytidine triphosphate deaminase